MNDQQIDSIFRQEILPFTQAEAETRKARHSLTRIRIAIIRVTNQDLTLRHHTVTTIPLRLP